jgi:hypothetical protein
LAGAGEAVDLCSELRGILEAGSALSPEEIAHLPLCASCTLEGFFFDETLKVYGFPHALHSQAHIRMGRDLKDVATSPNDGMSQSSAWCVTQFPHLYRNFTFLFFTSVVGPFTGYHANLDRNNMMWMTMLYLSDPNPVGDDMETTYKRYGYPENKDDVSMITRIDPPQVKYV